MTKQNELNSQFAKLKQTIQLDTAKRQSMYSSIAHSERTIKIKQRKKHAPLLIGIISLPILLLLSFTLLAKNEATPPPPDDLTHPIEKPSSANEHEVVINTLEHGSVVNDLLEPLIRFFYNYQLASEKKPIEVLYTVKLEGNSLVVDFNEEAYEVLDPSTAAGGYIMRHLNAIVFTYPDVQSVYYTINGNASVFNNYFGFVDEPVTRSQFFSLLSPSNNSFTPESYVEMNGYNGKYYTSTFTDSIIVIDESVSTFQQNDNYAVMGLIRNETAMLIGKANVHLKLYNEANELIEETTVASPVQSIRYGEPAPFYIESSTSFYDVSYAKIEVTTEEAYKSRDFEIFISYELPYGEKTFNQTVRDDPPYPYMIQYGVKNLGIPVTDVVAIVALVNPEGKIAHIYDTSLDVELGEASTYVFREIVIEHELAATAYKQFEKLIWYVEK